MSLESSVEEFAARFRQFAATGTVYPQPEGSPLIEFVTGGRVLYLFDRSGPYAVRPGETRLVVHGVVEEMSLLAHDDVREQTLSAVGVSAVEGAGEVLEVNRSLCVVQARTTLVLGRFGGWPEVTAGAWVRFRTVPPLHGFHI